MRNRIIDDSNFLLQSKHELKRDERRKEKIWEDFKNYLRVEIELDDARVSILKSLAKAGYGKWFKQILRYVDPSKKLSQRELRRSLRRRLKWLEEQGLIIYEKRRYRLSERGIELYEYLRELKDSTEFFE